MANGCETSLEPLVFERQRDPSLSLQPLPEKHDLTDPPPSKDKELSESSSPVPDKKSWFRRKKNDKSDKEKAYPAVNPVKIFKFASIIELLLMCLGLFAGLIQGGAFPFIFLSIGEVIDSFFKFETTASGCSTNFFANSSSGILYNRFYSQPIQMHASDSVEYEFRIIRTNSDGPWCSY